MSRLLPLLIAGCFTTNLAAGAPPDRPNIVLIVADDLGYGDPDCYGGPNATPNLDRMAREGVRFTDFYVAQAVCSASRAAILTGCYPSRVGIQGALGPNARLGLSHSEVTIAETLKPRGYATAFVGKWHLGDDPKFLPTRQGFDTYFGLPYSNDMWPNHPTSGDRFPPLKLYENETIIEQAFDQRTLTQRYAERSLAFIEASAAQPFYLHLAFAMPHVPLYTSEAFAGKTGRGAYADVLAEVDDVVGRILAAINRLNLDDRTLVLFTSDNGPWLPYGDHAGSSGGLREGKGSTFEGGVRVPFLARWPSTIPAGTVNDQPVMTIDLLPTIAGLCGAGLPDHAIDGLNISPLLLGEAGATSPHEVLYFWWGRELQAVRSDRWKLHFPHVYRVPTGQHGSGGRPAATVEARIELSLFDLQVDRNETTEVAAAHPEEVQRLQQLADKAREDLGDSATSSEGRGVRTAGHVD